MKYAAAAILIISSLSALDLEDPSDNFSCFMRTRGDTAGEEVVFYWSGSISSFVPGERGSLLFRADGYNIGRLVQVDDGYELLTREVFVYRDPASGEILDSWPNPFTGEEVEVVHVWNDPVNSYMPRSDGDWEFRMPYNLLDDGRICWNLDILLTYPSPLPVDSYPEFSASDIYQGAELFHFFVSFEDLENSELTSVPCQISWTRFGQWLPWMKMGQRPGYLIYHCSGSKLEGGYDALPEDIRELVEENHPEYTRAPEEWTSPNSTSWTYFRQLLEEQR